jgi:hypothetical protein
VTSERTSPDADALRAAVEEASPADVVPLPPGAAERARHVGRFGSVDAFLYDPCSVALSKLSRAREQDLEDVRALLRAGVIEGPELRRHFETIPPDYERRAVHADPERFRAALDRVAPLP